MASNSFCCPKCFGPTAVVDSRPKDVGAIVTVRRFRRCEVCKDRFATLEISEDDMALSLSLEKKLMAANKTAQRLAKQLSDLSGCSEE